MKNESIVSEQIKELRKLYEEIREKLDEADTTVDAIEDISTENQEAEDALAAQPALVNALREAEHGLTVALAYIRAQAPSPMPHDWHMQEPQWATRTALERVARRIDEHLA